MRRGATVAVLPWSYDINASGNRFDDLMGRGTHDSDTYHAARMAEPYLVMGHGIALHLAAALCWKGEFIDVERCLGERPARLVPQSATASAGPSAGQRV